MSSHFLTMEDIEDLRKMEVSSTLASVANARTSKSKKLEMVMRPTWPSWYRVFKDGVEIHKTIEFIEAVDEYNKLDC